MVRPHCIMPLMRQQIVWMCRDFFSKVAQIRPSPEVMDIFQYILLREIRRGKRVQD